MPTATPKLGLQKPLGPDILRDFLKGTIAGGGLHASFDILDEAVLLTAAQTLTNKTLTTPTVASFANAQHNHSNAAGGGGLTTPAITGAMTVTGDITIEETTAGLNLYAPAQALNEKRWVHNIETSNLVFRAVSDDSLSSAAWLAVNRTGIVINNVDLQAPIINVRPGAMTVATTGLIRLPNNQMIGVRDAAGTGNTSFGIDSNDRFTVQAAGLTTTATAGGASALPATPAWYMPVTINGGSFKIPLYAP